ELQAHPPTGLGPGKQFTGVAEQHFIAVQRHDAADNIGGKTPPHFKRCTRRRLVESRASSASGSGPTLKLAQRRRTDPIALNGTVLTEECMEYSLLIGHAWSATDSDEDAKNEQFRPRRRVDAFGELVCPRRQGLRLVQHRI